MQELENVAKLHKDKVGGLDQLPASLLVAAGTLAESRETPCRGRRTRKRRSSCRGAAVADAACHIVVDFVGGFVRHSALFLTLRSFRRRLDVVYAALPVLGGTIYRVRFGSEPFRRLACP